MKKNLLLLAVAAMLLSCTENSRAKRFGGNVTIEVKPNYRVVNATWKDGDLWYFTEAMPDNYEATNKYFIEKSNFGIQEGSVVFIEKKTVPFRGVHNTEIPWYLDKQ
jgi:hypothetical protein